MEEKLEALEELNNEPKLASQQEINKLFGNSMIYTAKVSECVFCDTEKIKSTVIDYGNCLVFEPLNPVVKGHLLVIPKVHTRSFTDNADISGEVMRVASLVAGERGGDYNLITSKGKSATQSVNHLHIHLVPRAENDGLMLPWSEPAEHFEQALLDVRRETIEEVRIVALNVAEEISSLSELVNGFQHRGYATERQESEIYFEGFKDGRDMMRIDFSLPSGRFAKRLREELPNTPTL